MQAEPGFWEHLAKWALGLIAALIAFVGETIRRWLGRQVGEQKGRIDDLEQRLQAQETKTATLEVHMENGARERADIKRAVDTVDTKVDRLVEHLLKDH